MKPLSTTNQLKTSTRKKPLPVALTAEQHKYLESKGNKAEYLRNLLIVDMAKVDKS